MPAECGEVVQPEQGRRRRRHGADIEWTKPRCDESGLLRFGAVGRQRQPVGVVASQRREAGVERRRGAKNPAHAHVLGKELGEPADQRIELGVVGPRGKTQLLEYLALLRVPPAGLLTFDGLDARSLDRAQTRLQLAYLGQAETFADTVAENIRVGRSDLTAQDVRRALEMVGLASTVARLPQGVGTPLASDGLPLSANDVSRLSIARAIVGRPRLLLINGMLDRLDLRSSPELIESLFDRSAPWTLVIVTARDDIQRRCDRTVEWS